MTHYINPDTSNRQKQFIKGTILGGSSIVKPNGGKNCYLSMRNKNASWMDFKATELNIFSSQTPFTIEKTNRWHSLCYPIFSDFYATFYKNKKRKLTLESLNDLSDIGLMVWYGDAGYYKKGIITINTNVWGKKGTETIAEYFSVITYEPTIFKERNSFRIKLDDVSSGRLLKLISPHLPLFFNQ